MDATERLKLEISDGVAHLTLSRPEKRNAIDEAFLDALERALPSVRDDRRVRVVLLDAAGPSFCSGFDLSLLKSIADERERRRRFAPMMRERIRRLTRCLEAWARLEPVTVACIQGAAAGGGWSLALACDLRVAAHDAIGWYPEVELGTPLSPVSCMLLSRLVPLSVAKHIVLTCRRLDAAEMLALGLVNQVVDRAGLAASARELCSSLAAKPAQALLVSKATLDALGAGRAPLRTDLLGERE